MSCQYLSCSSGTSTSSASQGTLRVCMSSIRRARSSASASADAGAADHQRRRSRVVRLQPRRPGCDQLRERQAAFQAVDGRRQFERGQQRSTPPAQKSARLRRCRPAPPAAAGSLPRCSAHRGTRRAPAAWRAASAGRLSRVARFSGLLPRLESVDEPAVDERGNDCAQEGRRRWNIENVHARPDWKAGLSWHDGLGRSALQASGDAFQHGAFRLADGVGRSDMHPRALEAHPEQPAGLLGGVEQSSAGRTRRAAQRRTAAAT